MYEQALIVPKPEHFVTPVFTALKQLSGAASKKEVIDRILANENISHELFQVEIVVRGRPQSELTRNIGFACTCLKENGLVNYPKRGFWSLTEEGRATDQIDQNDLWTNYEQIRKSRSTRQQEALDERSTGPVKILTKQELLQPVLDALHTLNGSGTALDITQQIIVSEQLVAPSLLENEFLKNSERARRLFNNVAAAHEALKKARLIYNRGNKWFLNKMILPTFLVDPRTVQLAEIETAEVTKIDKAVSHVITEIREEIKVETRQFAQSIKNELVQILRHEPAALDESGSKSIDAKTVLPVEKVSEESHSYHSLNHFLFYLQNLLYTRHADRPPNHYTTNLFNAGLKAITDKITEESAEVVEAALHESRERQISEVADLLVHTLILLVELNIPIEEVLDELQRRHEARST